ncbi:MAG: HD domain-containing phosphohydrolase [Thermodesulfobacteriota bacterium]
MANEDQGLGRSRILVVDDELTIRKSIQKRLEREGYEVTSADNAKDALQLFQENSFDTVISDIRMEEMDGLELLKRLQGQHRDIPVIMVTGAPSLDTAQESIKEGAYDYITKPIEREILINTVRRALEKKRLNDQIREYQRNLELKVREQTKTIFAIYKFANQLNSMDSLEDVVNSVVNFVADFLFSKRVSVMLLDEKGEYLTIKGASGLEEEIVKKTRIKRGESIAGKVLETGEAVIVNDISSMKAKSDRYSEYKSFISFPLIQVALKTTDLSLGIINVTNRFGDQPFTKEDLENLDFIADTASVAINNQLKSIEIEKSYFRTMKALAAAVEEKDRYTRGHSDRVKTYAVELAGRLGLPSETISTIEYACVLHDIGKIGIPDSIIQKDQDLTDDEYRQIMEHPAKGENIIRVIPFLEPARPIIRHHHERFDGTGYPDEMKGIEIELGARIIAIVDTYDAMTTERPYRGAFPKDHAISVLREEKGKQFDPELVDIFVRCLLDQGD